LNANSEAIMETLAMNARNRVLKGNRGVLLFLGALFPAIVRGEVTFQGYMATHDRPLFVLSTEKKETSSWLTIGQPSSVFPL
jgi:hypothetical protein